MAYLRQIFRSVDKDSSGTLSKDEIGTVMTQLRKGKRPPQAEIDQCFKDMDMVLRIQSRFIFSTYD